MPVVPMRDILDRAFAERYGVAAINVVDDLSLEEARSLTRPALTYVRGHLRGRLTARLARVHRRWLHPTSGRRAGDRFL